jgi:hypothetical protein
MASRKDYLAIAKVIAKVEDDAVRKSLADEIGAYFAAENPNFNYSVWRLACRIAGGEA